MSKGRYIVILALILVGCRARPIQTYPPEPTDGLLKGPIYYYNEAGKRLPIKAWTTGNLKEVRGGVDND